VGSNHKRQKPPLLQPPPPGQQSLAVLQPKLLTGTQHFPLTQDVPGQQSLLVVQAPPGLRHALQVLVLAPGSLTQLPLQQ
jgi:hypothetical protein